MLRSCVALLLTAVPLLPAPAAPAPLTSVAAVRALTLEEADRALPVRLRGVITYAESRIALTYLQDETGGTFVPSNWRMADGSSPAAARRQGAWVEIEGVTSRGKFIPHPEAPAGGRIVARLLGEQPLPQPVHPVRGGLPSHHLHNQWTEVDAYILDGAAGALRLQLRAIIGGQPLTIRVPERSAAVPPDLVGSDVRVRGVYTVDFNEEREMVGGNFFVQTLAQIDVLDAGLARAFALEARPIRDLLRFRPDGTQRARVRGTVTWGERTRGFFLSDGRDAAWVGLIDGKWPDPGTVVEVAGFPQREAGRIVLRDAVVRPAAGPAEPVAPVRATPESLRGGALHGRLVQAEARVTDRFTLPHVRVLGLADGAVAFQARLSEADATQPLPEPGSRVTVTGVCEMLPGRSDGIFQILLRSPADIAVVATPPWWTVARVAWLAGGLGLLVIGALGWGIMLRRRVEAQTATIREQVERQRVNEERVRIGRELHDTLEQHLTGVAMHLESAHAQGVGRDVSRTLDTATAMLKHSREEVRRSVWGLRSPVLAEAGLGEALRELAATMTTERTAVEFTDASCGARWSPSAEFNLFRIAQEAVANACKHADATRVRVHLAGDSRQGTLEIRDDGRGFDPAAAADDGRPHFGLQTMRERANRSGTRLRIASAAGQGTTVRVEWEQSA